MELVVAIVVITIALIFIKFILFIIRSPVRSIMTYLGEYQTGKKIPGQSQRIYVRMAKWISNKYWQNIYKNRERN